jgi:UDP-glucose 4-epimerase
MLRAPIKDQTVLVTGGAGFIGSHIVDACLAQGAKHVIAVDNLFLGNENNLKNALETGNATFYKDDIEIRTSLDYIFENYDIDVVFNCATKALNYSFLNPENAFSTNVTGALNLLELQRSGKFKTLCHFSTSEVYGSAVYEPMDESHPKNPLTTYAAGKAAADLAVESYVRMFDLDAFIVRPFNNYGPRQNHKGMLAGIIPITAYRILNDITPEIHGTGDQTRDFIHVFDTVNAVMKLYDKMEPAESINISTNNQVSMNDLVTSICNIMSYKGDVLRKPERKSDVECHNACNKKIHGMIDYKLTPFDDGLKSTLDWYKDNI